MTPETRAYLATMATPDELRAILGPKWTIARRTPGNIERYETYGGGRLITRKQYEDAEKLALARRKKLA